MNLKKWYIYNSQTGAGRVPRIRAAFHIKSRLPGADEMGCCCLQSLWGVGTPGAAVAFLWRRHFPSLNIQEYFMFDHGRLSDTYIKYNMKTFLQNTHFCPVGWTKTYLQLYANEFQSLVETFCRFKSQAKVFVTSSIAECRYLQVEIWLSVKLEWGLSGFFNQPAPFTDEIWKWKPWHADMHEFILATLAYKKVINPWRWLPTICECLHSS